MPEATKVTNEALPLPKRSWSRISLATLVLLVTVAAFAISHFLTSRDLEKTRSELSEYRFQHGDLVVEDPEKIHLLSFVDQKNPWKWYSHFPKSRQYQIVFGIGVFGPDDIPDLSKLKHAGVMPIVGKGSLTTLSVSIAEPDPSTVELRVSHDGASLARQFPKAEVTWLNMNQSTFKISGYREPLVVDNKSPVLIFWSRKPKVKANTVMLESDPTDGIIVFAVPVK